MRHSFNLLGPQGSGKGTQAQALVKHFDFFHFDAGESLRQIRATGGDLGKEVASYIDGGNRVPPRLIAEMTYQTLLRAPTDKDILFDGLLRAMDEFEAQKTTFGRLQLDPPVIIFLDIDQATALDRIAKRRICVGCGNRVVIHTPEDIKVCQRCGGHLETRHDDTPAATKQRLSWYYRDTLPVVEYFRKNGAVIDIDARPPISEVTKSVVAAVENYYKMRGLILPYRKG